MDIFSRYCALIVLLRTTSIGYYDRSDQFEFSGFIPLVASGYETRFASRYGLGTVYGSPCCYVPFTG